MKIPGMPKVKAYVTIIVKDMYSLILYMQSMIQEDMEDQSQLEIPWMKCGFDCHPKTKPYTQQALGTI